MLSGHWALCSENRRTGRLKLGVLLDSPARCIEATGELCLCLALAKKNSSLLPTQHSLRRSNFQNKYDLAKYFNVTLRTIDRWVKERRIPSIQMGSRCTRFEWPAVKKAVARHLVEEVK